MGAKDECESRSCSVQQRIYLGLCSLLPRGPAAKVTLKPKKAGSDLHSAYLFTPSVPKNVHTGTVKPAKLPVSHTLQPGFDRDLGWLQWQGTHRVTQIYLQHSSISLYTRCCLLMEIVV